MDSSGWGNSSWNVLVQIANPFTWSWKNSSNEMNSRYFDRKQSGYGVDSHCYVKLGVSYVFGFGKHVKQNNEASRQNGAGSAILEKCFTYCGRVWQGCHTLLLLFYSATSLTGMARYLPLLIPDEPDTNR